MLTINKVMESFDMFLNTNFIALSYFQKEFGNAEDNISAAWQSALFQSGQAGAFIGVFLSGPITSRIGYRWTTILALMLINCTIFIAFFVSTWFVTAAAGWLAADKSWINYRPKPSLLLRSDKHLKVFLGASLLQTLPPMPVRLLLSLFAVPARLLYR